MNDIVKPKKISSQTAMISITLITLSAFYLLFMIFPIVYAFIGSFSNWNPMLEEMSFVGLDNYISVLGNPIFYKALVNTLVFTLVVVFLRMAIGLFLAVMIDQMKYFKNFFRTIYFLPVVTSILAVSLVWVWMFEPTSGIINQFLNFLGFSSLGWLKDQYLVLPSIMIMTIWKDVGFAMVFYLAGLNNISDSLYEAADIDGASRFNKFIHIQIPMLKPQTVLITVTGIITYIMVFDQVFMMTDQAGPNNAAITMVYFLYDEAFNNFRFGNAAVMAFVIFVLTFVFSLFQMRSQNQT